jgi:hypothetical protein
VIKILIMPFFFFFSLDVDVVSALLFLSSLFCPSLLCVLRISPGTQQRWLFKKENGAINKLLKRLGLSPPLLTTSSSLSPQLIPRRFSPCLRRDEVVSLHFQPDEKCCCGAVRCKRFRFAVTRIGCLVYYVETQVGRQAGELCCETFDFAVQSRDKLVQSALRRR